jgi:hypothetical protein
MPFYLLIFSRLVAYPIRQAVQSIGSTSGPKRSEQLEPGPGGLGDGSWHEQ